jgi:hypothetical protein
MLLRQPRQPSQPLKAVVPNLRVITPMPGLHLVRDVPKKFKAHTNKIISTYLLYLKVSQPAGTQRAHLPKQVGSW